MPCHPDQTPLQTAIIPTGLQAGGAVGEGESALGHSDKKIGFLSHASISQHFPVISINSKKSFSSPILVHQRATLFTLNPPKMGYYYQSNQQVVVCNIIGCF